MFYTYLWLREDGTPYYVGKGKGRRAFINHRKNNVRVPKCLGRILVQEHLCEQDSLFSEKFLISYYGRKDLGLGLLLNRTDGGEGISGLIHTKVAKDKIREFQKAHKKTAEHIKNAADSQRGKNKRSRTDAEKQHLSVSLKDKPWTPSRRAAEDTKATRMAICHPDRKHRSGGLCGYCAFKKWTEDSGRKLKRRTQSGN